jgi:nitrogen-specific signal transduction histidine kinase/CheY-like chemotaxis protein
MVPLRNGEGRIVAALGVTRDTTEQRQLEAQLRQTQKMESIGLLAGGVAHDFNNLLTIIAGNSETMAATLGPGSPVAPLVAEILRAAERAASLTRQLLVFSRRQVQEPIVLELNAVVTETEKMLRRLIGEDVVLTVELDKNISLVKVDPGSLVQVLMNLAVNARDAMPRGGRLTIRTGDTVVKDGGGRSRTGPPSGRYATLIVADTGVGMTADVKARLFEPFFSTKRVEQGTGLGLAVVHGIVAQSGGSVQVESELNRGTTFTIYFPAVGEPATALRETVSGKPRGTETVLVAEDEPDVRNLAARALEGCGYTVLEAADGREALRVVDRHKAGVDLVVADVVMPEMDGRQLVEALRERYPGVKVLYTSGYTDDAVVRRGVLRSEVVLLQKPYTPQTLLHKCREVLAGPRKRPH